ncbi:MAG: acyl-CoA dehydrogenase family protein [Methylocystaceae bacterium]|nr:acyl-CoA dehydrogenase family protein [Methylocystaceae bacterium]
MDFSLNDIQEMMRDSASKFIQKEYDFETRRKLSKSEDGFSQKNWELFAELGWLALPIDEDQGGIGGTVLDTIILQEELGKGLVVEPYFPCILLGANLINSFASDEQKEALLGPILEGSKKITLAHSEGHSPFDISQIKTVAEKTNNGFVINGKKSVVLNAQHADELLVVARTSGNTGDKSGLSVFVVSKDHPGLSIRGYETNDGLRAGDVTFVNVTLGAEAVLGTLDDAFGPVQKVLLEGIVNLAGEAVGIMEKLVDLTGEYLRIREQFNAPIGKFQALQHRCADMFMEKEQAKSMLYFAAIETAKQNDDYEKACAMLKVRIGNAARFVGQQAVQLHGGMGVTDELSVGHYFKRLTTLNAMLGSRDYHLNELVKSA